MTHRRTLALVASMVLLLAACGGTSDPITQSDEPTTTPAVTQPAPAEEDPGTATDPVVDADEPSPVNCPELVAAISGAANAAAALGGDPSQFPVANTRALADRLPEIRDDLLIVADAYDTFFQRLEELGVDFTDPSSLAGLDEATMAELDAVGAALDSDEVGQANENIQAFFDRECS